MPTQHLTAQVYIAHMFANVKSMWTCLLSRCWSHIGISKFSIKGRSHSDHLEMMSPDTNPYFGIETGEQLVRSNFIGCGRWSLVPNTAKRMFIAQGPAAHVKLITSPLEFTCVPKPEVTSSFMMPDNKRITLFTNNSVLFILLFWKQIYSDPSL